MEDVERRYWELLSLIFLLLIFLSIFSLLLIYQQTSIFEEPLGNIYFYSFLILSIMFITYVNETRKMLASLKEKLKNEQSLINRIKEESIKENLQALVTKEHFEDCLAMEFKRAQASSSDFSLIVINIKNLVEIDQKYGYKTGNEIICEITRIFRELIGGNSDIFRYSTEIYSSILPLTNQKELQKIIFKVEHEIKQIVLPDGEKIDFSVNGISYPSDTTSLHEIRKLMLD